MLLKMRLWHRCFPVNFVKILRKPIKRTSLVAASEEKCHETFHTSKQHCVLERMQTDHIFWKIYNKYHFLRLSISLRFVINLRFTRETESILSKYVNITRTLEANPVNAMLISQDQNDTSFQKMDA